MCMYTGRGFYDLLLCIKQWEMSILFYSLYQSDVGHNHERSRADVIAFKHSWMIITKHIKTVEVDPQHTKMIDY